MAKQTLPQGMDKIREGVYRYRGFIIKREEEGTKSWTVYLPWNVETKNGMIQHHNLACKIGYSNIKGMKGRVDDLLAASSNYFKDPYWGDRWLGRLMGARELLPLFLAQLGSHNLPADGELMKHIGEVLEGLDPAVLYPGTGTDEPIYA